MNLDPVMGSTDRIISLAAGAVLIIYASLGNLNSAAVSVLVIVVGSALAIGGIGGT
ncbi:MAG TPA: YgaP-like transmembrane domain [Acidobacteriota bacterium]|nr:YgaP-like transmembrane domain [Acidobacteriota bacterium]